MNVVELLGLLETTFSTPPGPGPGAFNHGNRASENLRVPPKTQTQTSETGFEYVCWGLGLWSSCGGWPTRNLKRRRQMSPGATTRQEWDN